MPTSKTLVTHIRPHLDDIAGMWLLRKYLPSWKRARLHFIPTSATGATYGSKKVDADPNILHVGVGRGAFDEHKGNVGESAASLVLGYLRRHGHLPKDQNTRKALGCVIDYVLEDDLGKRKGIILGWQYEIGTVLMWIPDSDERSAIGFTLLDALLYFFKDYGKLDKDWRKKKVFRTKWGRSVGVVSDQKGTMRAYDEGYVLIAQVDPKRGYRSIRAHASSRADLTEAYKQVKKLEPHADWYFHHSKKMLICGSEVAPQSVRSKLTLKQLIKLVRA